MSLIKHSLVFLFAALVGWSVFQISKSLDSSIGVIPPQPWVFRNITGVTYRVDYSRCAFDVCPPSETITIVRGSVFDSIPNAIKTNDNHQVSYGVVSTFDFDRATRHVNNTACADCVVTILTVAHDGVTTSIAYIGGPYEPEAWTIEKAILGLSANTTWKNRGQ